MNDIKDIIITGATGFIGNHMANYFIKKGYNVIAIVRPDSNKKDLLNRYSSFSNFKYIEENLFKIETLKNKISKADLFFNFAWNGVNRNGIDNEKIQNDNIELSLKSLEFANDIGCNVFVNAGSRQEYGNINGTVNEETICNPITEYGKAKLKFANIAKDFSSKNNIKVIHSRIFSAYGIYDHPWSLINTLISNLHDNIDMELGLCQHYWNFMYINDVVEAINKCCESINNMDLKFDIVNIASKESLILKEYIYIIYKLLNSKSNLLFGTFKEAKGSTVSIYADVSKLNSIYNFKENYTFEDGIKKIISYKYSGILDD
uniref:NAD-dependent epimerase/dehydratase family protein n=1 Tax=Brachyspira catarrhinii TaxID=2528966 RepID=UPI003F4C2076